MLAHRTVQARQRRGVISMLTGTGANVPEVDLRTTLYSLRLATCNVGTAVAQIALNLACLNLQRAGCQRFASPAPLIQVADALALRQRYKAFWVGNLAASAV